MKKLAILFVYLTYKSLVLFGQCSYMIDYVQNPYISDKKGIPCDNNSYYFPVIVGTDTVIYFRIDSDVRLLPLRYKDEIIAELGQEAIIDSIRYHAINDYAQKYYSRYMYEFNEPILYNYYLEKDIVRLTCFSSQDPPSLIKIEKKDNEVIMHKKALNSYISNLHINKPSEDYQSAIKSEEKLLEIIVDTIIYRTKEQFTELMALIDTSKITSLVPYESIVYGLDGVDWILEIHTNRGYYYIKRWEIQDTPSFQEIVDYIETMNE